MARRSSALLIVGAVGCAAGPDDDVGAEHVGVAPGVALGPLPQLGDASAKRPPRASPDWGPGFRELVAPPSARALVVDPGDLDAVRGAQSTAVWLADLDVDGVIEVVTSTVLHDALAPAWHARVLRWTDDGLVDDDALAASLEDGGTRAGGPDAPLAAFDLDGDGLLDLLGGTPEAAVRWGTAPGVFGPWTDLTGRTWPARGLTLGLDDLDRDGWLDLVLGSDLCDVPAALALRTGPRAFTLVRDAFDGPPAVARSVLTGATDEGEPLLFVVDDADVCGRGDPRSRFLRLDHVDADLVPRFVAYDPTPPDAWWKQWPAYAGSPLRLMAPMGAGLDDLDGDGRLDLVVTTGLSPQVVLGGVGGGRFEAGEEARYVRPEVLGKPEFPWSVAFPDLDLDGRPEIVWTIGDDQTSFLVQQGHPMRSAVTWSPGDLTWQDQAIGLDAAGSWRGLAVGDPDGDGDADVVLGGHGNPPAVYRNDVDTGARRPLALRLVGTTSNALAVGARVEAWLHDGTVRTTLVGGLGNRLGTSEPLVFLGAGDADTLDQLRITWPSGLVQELDDVAAGGQLTVREPVTVAVLDADRHAEVGGEAVVVEVTPRRPDGSVAPDVDVQLRIEGVPADVAALGEVAGVHRFALSSDRAGTSAVVVRIAGAPLAVRPKLWWTAAPG